MERKGESDWRLVEPRKGKAREAKINDLLFTLRALKWSELGLIVGRKEGDKTYLKTKASPALYAVESRHLGDLPKVPDDFLS